MSKQCHNCNAVLLDDDTECWQCGASVAAAAPEGPKVKETWEDPASLSLSATTVYAGLTALVVVAALIVTVSLGREPLAQVASTPVPDDWIAFTDPAGTFVLALPPEWKLFARDSLAADEFAQLLDDNAIFRRATHPLGDLTEDVDLVLVAASETPAGAGTPPAFAVVARSDTLNRLSLAQAVDEGNKGDTVEVLNATIIETFDSRYASFAIATSDVAEETVRCQQRFRPGRETSVLVAVCTRPGGPSTVADQIISSFQRLIP